MGFNKSKKADLESRERNATRIIAIEVPQEYEGEDAQIVLDIYNSVKGGYNASKVQADNRKDIEFLMELVFSMFNSSFNKKTFPPKKRAKFKKIIENYFAQTPEKSDEDLDEMELDFEKSKKRKEKIKEAVKKRKGK